MTSADNPEVSAVNDQASRPAEAAQAFPQPVKAAPAATPPADPNPQPDPVAAPARWNPPARSLPTSAVIVLLIAGAIIAILYAWQLPPFGGRYEQTDNAYVRGQTTVISPQVSGYVAQVPVKDFDHVKAGQILVRIEDRIYNAKVAQARANVLTQVASLNNSVQAQKSKEASELSQDAGIANAEAQLLRVQADTRRINSLIARGWVSQADLDRQVAALRAAEAQLREARAGREIGRQDVRTVVVGRAGLSANVEAAKAQVRLAQIDLDHAVIRAPLAGQLSEVGVRQGQYVTAGTQLMFLVPNTHWVTANFKEAQTRKMRVGQLASFTIDALGGARLKGHVENLAPAAGSEFAVLRPDNATGNFVKVAQRIAVRIQVDPGQRLADRLRPGMSVVARIETGR
jgi:multidrug resistance efflux pump